MEFNWTRNDSQEGCNNNLAILDTPQCTQNYNEYRYGLHNDDLNYVCHMSS